MKLLLSGFNDLHGLFIHLRRFSNHGKYPARVMTDPGHLVICNFKCGFTEKNIYKGSFFYC